MTTSRLIIHILKASFYLDLILFFKIVHMLIRFWVVFSDFRQFFVCILVVIARNILFVQHEGL